MSADDPVAPTPPVPSGGPRRRPVARFIVLAVVLLLLLPVLAVLGLVGALFTGSGSAFVLRHVPGVSVTAPAGALLAGDFSADRVAVRVRGRDDAVVVDGLAWRQLHLSRGAAAGQWARIDIDRLQARHVAVALPPEPDPPAASTPLTPPQSLRLPVELTIGQLAVGLVEAAALGTQPLHDLTASVHLGDASGTQHHIDAVSVAWDRWLATASVGIAADAPFALTARSTLAVAQTASAPASAASSAVASLPMQARVRIDGPLARPVAVASIDAAPAGVAAAPASTAASTPTLQARAVLTPFAAWPLAELQADATDFDAAAWVTAAPRTALTGSARIDTTGVDRPAQVTLDLRNAASGRWDTGRLPVARLQGRFTGTPDRLDRVDISDLVADLGTAADAAGTLRAAGHWTPAGTELDLQLADVRPAGLDARAPAMRLGGTVHLAAAPAASAAAADASGMGVQVRADIDGTLADGRTARSVSLRLDAGANAARVDVRTARVAVGAATATLVGSAKRSAAAPAIAGSAPAAQRWDIDAQAKVDGMDPFVWWPGAAPAGRHGPTLLKSTATVVLRGVDLAATAAPAAWLPSLDGKATLDLTDSTVLGVPLTAAVSLRREGAAAASVTARLDAAGNTLNATGQVDPAQFTATPGHPAQPGSDSADLRIAAPDLSRLAPLWALVSPTQVGGSQLPVQGSLNASGSARGRWPTLTTDGRFDATGLRVGTTALEQAHGQWSLGTSSTAPANLQIAVTGASSGAAAVDTAELQLQGTARSHDLRLTGALKALPPAWVDAVQSALAPTPGASAPAASPPDAVRRTTLTLAAHGGVVDAGGRFGGWKGTLAQVDVTTGAGTTAPLLHTADVAIDYRAAPVDAAGAPTGDGAQLGVQPGRLDVLGAAVRWSRIDWRGGAGTAGHGPRLDGRIDLDPLRLAPILAVLQPDVGWGGDLAVAGHAAFRSTPTIGADVVLERQAGDLTLTEAGDEGETRTLGLTTLRIALTAQDGVWRFTPAIAGNTLGVVAGAVTATAPAQDLWPAPSSALDGVVTLAVADLGNLGGWIPAGWRLRGALRAAAHVGGTVGAPTYTGELQGNQLGVRNFLQGVDVTDGDIAATLKGTTATIDHFTARAGTGTLRIDGGMTFGAKPQAALTLQATKFQVIGRVDRRIVLSGNARALLRDDGHLALTGALAVDEGLIDFSHSDAPTRSADVHVRRGDQTMWSQKEIEAAQNADSELSLRNLALDLTLSLGNALRLRGHGFQSGLAGDLRITSPGGQLAFDGTIRTTDGTYNAYGQKLAIDRGDITFTGSADNPRLDVQAVRPDLDTRVGVAITGTALAPKVRLFSEPDMSDIDKISMLMLGHASDGLGGSDLALLQSAALGLVSGEGSGEPGTAEKLTKSLGLDALSVRQGSTNDVRDAVVSLGKQISQHWYVGYERGIGNAAGSVQLIYRLARRITLRAQSGGDNSIDAIWSWRWDKPTAGRAGAAPPPARSPSTN